MGPLFFFWLSGARVGAWIGVGLNGVTSERSEVVVVVIMILWYRLKRAFWFLGKPRGVVFEGNMQMVKFFTAHLIALMKVFALSAWICFSY